MHAFIQSFISCSYHIFIIAMCVGGWNVFISLGKTFIKVCTEKQNDWCTLTAELDVAALNLYV